MATDFDALSDQALQLPVEDRIKLARRISESLDKQQEIDADLLARVAQLKATMERGLADIPIELLSRDLSNNLPRPQ